MDCSYHHLFLEFQEFLENTLVPERNLLEKSLTRNCQSQMPQFNHQFQMSKSKCQLRMSNAKIQISNEISTLNFVIWHLFLIGALSFVIIIAVLSASDTHHSSIPLFQCSNWIKAPKFPYNQVIKILPVKVRKLLYPYYCKYFAKMLELLQF
jgi:hypothetical protein